MLNLTICLNSITAVIKEIVHPKTKVLSLFIHPRVFPNPYDIFSSIEHNKDDFKISLFPLNGSKRGMTWAVKLQNHKKSTIKVLSYSMGEKKTYRFKTTFLGELFVF